MIRIARLEAASTSENPHAEHGDERVEELRQQYGDLAAPELQGKARQQGVSNPSQMKKEELLEALSGGGRGGNDGGNNN